MIVREAGGFACFGYFLLAQLPTSLPQTISTTPVLSGLVVLDAN